MEQRISLREANQHFSRYIKVVEAGKEVIITRRGEPVAKLTPIPQERVLNDDQQNALARTKARMREGYPLGGKTVCRDDLYDR
ncbi:MAG: type II toxin-antitoxin system prevent-host-death family antitoxin [Magnetococcales bacterium]|nr:type II toxin-antitoxin system prevent-host-death family antitoxin [Magnetococcales bacterium]